MKLLKNSLLIVAGLTLCFGVGAFFFHHAIAILDDGELTYSRRGQLPVTVSPGLYPFSYYYQLAFFGTAAAFFLLLGIAMCMYLLAKFMRLAGSPESARAAVVYDLATKIAWTGIACSAMWFVLRIFRSVLIQ